MKCRHLFVATLPVLLAVCAYTTYRGFEVDAHDKDVAHRLHDYCAGLRGQLEADRIALTYGDSKTKARVGEVFSNALVFTSLERVDLCSSHPPDLHAREVCWVRGDYECLVRLATTARDAIDY